MTQKEIITFVNNITHAQLKLYYVSLRLAYQKQMSKCIREHYNYTNNQKEKQVSG